MRWSFGSWGRPSKAAIDFDMKHPIIKSLAFPFHRIVD